MEDFFVSICLLELGFYKSRFRVSGYFRLYDEESDLYAVHRCTSCRSRMRILPFTVLHLAVVQRPVNDGKVFKKKRNNLCFSVIMKKLGALRSLFMKYSVHKGRFTPNFPPYLTPKMSRVSEKNSRYKYNKHRFASILICFSPSSALCKNRLLLFTHLDFAVRRFTLCRLQIMIHCFTGRQR